jgi:ElaB/YqjD/DUF883 family membrane-anchored ribosome-binding protein
MADYKFPGDEALTEAAGTLREQAAETASDLRGSMSDMAQKAGTKMESGRAAAADRIEDAASSVRRRADELPGGPRVQNFAQAAADRLSSTADYVRDADARRLRGDVETMVKNNPGPALLVAAMFGFLLGRALSRD